MTETLERKIDRINEKISTLLKKEDKEKITWVKVSVITGLTGWDHEKMRQARENGYVKFKTENGKFWYALESLSSVWFNHKKTA